MNNTTNTTNMNDIEALLPPIRRLHEQIRAAVVATCEEAALEELSEIAEDDEGDTIYAVDKVSEELLIEFFEQEVAPHVPIVLIAEGLAGGQVTLPHGVAEEEAVTNLYIDQI